MNENFDGLESVLDAIYADGWISGYKIYRNERCIEIFLKYDSRDKTLITRVKNLTKPSLVSFIRLHELAADSKNTAHTGIIRTAKYGFLPNRTALKKKTGGIYLAKIF